MRDTGQGASIGDPTFPVRAAAADLPWRIRLHSNADSSRQELLGLLIVFLLVVVAASHHREAMPSPEIAWAMVLLLAAARIEAARCTQRRARRWRRGDALVAASEEGLRLWLDGGRRRGRIDWADLAQASVGHTTTRRGRTCTGVVVEAVPGRGVGWSWYVDGDESDAGRLVDRVVRSNAAAWRACVRRVLDDRGAVDRQVWALLENCPGRVNACPSCAYQRTGLPPESLCPECGAAPPGPEGARGGDPVMESATAVPHQGSRRWTGRWSTRSLRRMAWAVALGFGAIVLTFGGCLSILVLAVVGLAALMLRRPTPPLPESRRWTIARRELIIERERAGATSVPWASIVRATAAAEDGDRPCVRLQYAVPGRDGERWPQPRLDVAALPVVDADAARRIRRAIELRVMGEVISRDDRREPPAEAPA